MLSFNARRDAHTADEFWVLTHPPVFTQGVSSKQQPTTNPMAVPIVKSDRGGQITYHGPGQLIIYCLLDLKRIGIGPKKLVKLIEQAIINFHAEVGLIAKRRRGAPGVYLDDRKIAALGLRISKGYCYHGLCINVNMDLSPFELIDPCGYPGLEVTSLSKAGVELGLQEVAERLCAQLKELIYV